MTSELFRTPAGAQLRLRTFGRADAPVAILVLHGFAQTADFVEPLAAALLRAGDVLVVAPDLRAHGDSDDLPPTGAADDVFVEDALAVWSTRIGRPAVWYGNSLGARIAALAVAARPEAATALFLGECLAGLERNWELLLAGARKQAVLRPALFATLDAAHDYGVSSRGLRAEGLAWWLRHGLRAVPSGGFEEKLRLMGVLDATRWPELRTGAVERRLGTLTGPVHLLYAAQGSAVSEQQQDRVAALFVAANPKRGPKPGPKITRLASAGHDLYLDVPEALARLLLALPSAAEP